ERELETLLLGAVPAGEEEDARGRSRLTGGWRHVPGRERAVEVGDLDPLDARREPVSRELERVDRPTVRRVPALVIVFQECTRPLLVGATTEVAAASAQIVTQGALLLRTLPQSISARMPHAEPGLWVRGRGIGGELFDGRSDLADRAAGEQHPQRGLRPHVVVREEVVHPSPSFTYGLCMIP